MEREEIIKQIDVKVQEILNIEDPVEFVKEFTKFLRKMHPSDAWKYAQDLVPAKNSKVMVCKKTNTEVYQELQDLIMTCKKSYQHDNDYATNLDVDKAVSKAYGMTLRMIRAVIDMENDRFNKITSAINRIEVKVGLEPTNFEEGDNNDSTNNENAQRIEEDIPGVGETSEAE